ncbi:MAG TPA: hypothetical protein VGH05_20515 [Buttiauxella sp.]|jgi:hypothetical protein
MSAKERFLQKLQQHRAVPGSYESKSQADIAAFRQRMGQLQADIEGWLEGTGVRIESTTVSLVELLVDNRSFDIPGIELRLENRIVKFTPVFLYGQGVTGCVEASLCADGKVQPLSRLFMRSGENINWTCTPPTAISGLRRAFNEDAFFEIIEGLLP